MSSQDATSKGIITSRATYPPHTPTFEVGDDYRDSVDALDNQGSERLVFIPAPKPHELVTQEPEIQSRGRRLESYLRRLFYDNVGLLLIGLSQFFGSCMGASVQILNRLDRPIPPAEILLVRQSITWLLTYLYMRHQDVPNSLLGPPEVRYLLVIRGISGFCGVFGLYYSLQYLSLPDATVLTFLSPFFISFAGTFFLGESFSRRNFFAGLFSLVGVVLIARPTALFGHLATTGSDAKDSAERGTSQQRLLAVAVSMVGVFGASGAYVSLRAIGKRAHLLHSMNYFALFSIIISVILMIIERTKPVVPDHWKYIVLLLSVSVFGFLTQSLLIFGLRKETASRGSLAIYIQIVYASMLERILFHVTPSMLSLFGTVIILGSALYVGLTKEKCQGRPVNRHGRTISEDDDDLGELGISGSNEHSERHENHIEEEAACLLEEGLVLSERIPTEDKKLHSPEERSSVE
ncbi:hypothetical protein K439DRAFT_1627884 [Ramaria rubella]|nr:hypothetical protein K439DRAFT_1627884 [Ramaria rubella]